MRQSAKRKYLIISLLLILAEKNFAATDTSGSPTWMHDAVVYGIKPSSFVKDARFDDITKKIPELKQLGINTIWLQPVFKTAQGGQGYDVIDFFSLRDDLGTPEELKKLVATAKANGIRMLFDFVPNHTSVAHPYALDIIRNGKASPYYNYYQHENDGVAYCSFYHKDSSGFIYYFWKNLVNLNYGNDTVQRMIIDACKYWIKEYGIDGYRFDAVWAVNARAPQFGKRLRDELRALKPDVLLLAEDKGNDANVYQRGFDAAYDWTADTAWVSQWSWQYKHDPKKSFTVFNHPLIARRKTLLEKSLFSNTENNTRVLRFMENNDLSRFIAGHTLEQTRMAAGIMFSMPGIPLIFCGQEIGFRGHPYSRKAIFDSRRTIQEQDSFGLFNFYHSLIEKRLAHEALKSGVIEEIPILAPGVVAYSRGTGKERVLVIANLDSAGAHIKVPGQYLAHKRVLDLISGKKVRQKRKKGLAVDGYGILWLTPASKK